ncbi:acetyl-CoA hydrolase/transferase family protein [Amycolatopsis sp. K13G38]|uniref:Acetyl-CoA hydrolase/transferase family protein n=1 Tax=Amycolatopsis acididurans TaxID=2724524 RepID=A0ABX1J347_9PSEU|nr:acetyl-CoA hydrolase/transferase family protein [Amycolatopsis acididurans]NKQ54197.1 acetyl-CoA hydrolase/transferase family protein [Amycolatopsis acididurans]
MTVHLDSPGKLDFACYVRPGDTVIWGQACAEPVALTSRLLERRADIGRFRCFLGLPAAGTVQVEHGDRVSFVSYCGAGGNRALWQSGALDILPSPYSALPALFASRRFPIDVVLLLVPPPDEDGRYCLGLAEEYLPPAIDAARVVIAEVSENVPWVHGSRLLDETEIDVIVHTVTEPAAAGRKRPGAAERRIAELVAGLVEDGSTLQCGIGALPETILRALAGHRDLGVHSGLVTDAVADLMQAGVVTNARKTVDRHVSVGGMLMGSKRLFSFAHRNPAVRLRPTAYTHDPRVLGTQRKFVAINSALEVDLTGQVNAEIAAGNYVGAVGGALDFVRGAHASPGGKAIVALPSESGGHSRIVGELRGPVSTPRSEVDFVVTEHGVADLRGLGLAGRREAMLAVAAPGHRAALTASDVRRTA